MPINRIGLFDANRGLALTTFGECLERLITYSYYYFFIMLLVNCRIDIIKYIDNYDNISDKVKVNAVFSYFQAIFSA